MLSCLGCVYIKNDHGCKRVNSASSAVTAPPTVLPAALPSIDQMEGVANEREQDTSDRDHEVQQDGPPERQRSEGEQHKADGEDGHWAYPSLYGWKRRRRWPTW